MKTFKIILAVVSLTVSMKAFAEGGSGGGGVLSVAAKAGDRYVRVLGEHNGELFYEYGVVNEKLEINTKKYRSREEEFSKDLDLALNLKKSLATGQWELVQAGK